MIRISLLLAGLVTLSACEPYREPRANCFSFVSRGPASVDCTYAQLAGRAGPGWRDD